MVSMGKSDNRPKDLPFNPYKYYTNCGWNGWDDFLGTENIDHVASKNWNFRSFDNVKSYAQSLNFKSSLQWR